VEVVVRIAPLVVERVLRAAEVLDLQEEQQEQEPLVKDMPVVQVPPAVKTVVYLGAVEVVLVVLEWRQLDK
jgi:hypothetical protein